MNFFKIRKNLEIEIGIILFKFVRCAMQEVMQLRSIQGFVKNGIVSCDYNTLEYLFLRCRSHAEK